MLILSGVEGSYVVKWILDDGCSVLGTRYEGCFYFSQRSPRCRWLKKQTQYQPAAGNPNSAYSLDGIDDWMAGASYDVINPSALSSFAVSFWFSPASTWTTGDNPNTMLVGNIVNDPPYYNPRGWFDWGVMISSSAVSS